MFKRYLVPDLIGICKQQWHLSAPITLADKLGCLSIGHLRDCTAIGNKKKMQFLYIVLAAIGLFGCGVEEDTPIAPAPVVNVEPPVVNVEPPEVTIQPTEVTVQPPDITIQPTEVTVQPPDITIQPTEVTVQPPTVNVHPPAVTVQPPTVNVLPGVDSTPPVMLSGTVTHEEDNVNPGPINAAGLQFHFNEPVTGIIKLTDAVGVNLNWLSNVVGQTGTLTVFAGTTIDSRTNLHH